MSVSQPLVTVLLPCYNVQEFLRPTLDSVIGQTYRNLEILTIDDGSSDATPEILAEYAARDPRVRLTPNDRNHGLIYTLNKGIGLAKGSLVARMDSDDIALPRRIEQQVRYFAKRPETELLSSDVSYMGMNGRPLFNPIPYRFSNRTIRFLMFFLNPVCHPTVMGRREVFLKHPYSPQALHVEDFELWHRMVEHGVVIRNLPCRLLRFRSNICGVSRRNEETQVGLFLRLTADAIERYFGLRPDPDVHRILTNRMLHGTVRRVHLNRALRLFRDMRREYIEREKLGRDDRTIIDDFADRHLLNVLLHGYKRSCSEDPTRRLAAREVAMMTLRNAMPSCLFALERTRERISRHNQRYRRDPIAEPHSSGAVPSAVEIQRRLD
jgi:glycosyltransferase involved in cell wall biosynthesis